MAVPLAGAKILASDLSGIFATDTGAWTTYTPTLTQSGAVTKTVTEASYMKIGRLVIASGYLTCTGAGSANNAVLVGVPVTAASGSAVIGSGWVYDASSSAWYAGPATLQSTSVFGFALSGNTALVAGATGSGFTAALANTDQVRYAIMYQSAS